MLRNGVRHGRAQRFTLLRHAVRRQPEGAGATRPLNRFSITRQLRYSSRNPGLALDLALFINGLPVATFELKNSLTKQTVADAEEQYKRDRDPREDLFKLGRCMAHFAVDDQAGAVLHRAQGKGILVPAVQQGQIRRRGQPRQSRTAL